MPAPPVTAAEAARLRLKRQRLRRHILFFVYGIPLLLLAVAVYLAFGPKPPPPPKFVAVSPQRAAAATQSIDAVRQALTQPPPTPPPAASPSAPTGKTTSPAPTSSPAQPAMSSSAPVQVTHTANGQDQVTLRISQADLNAYLNGNPNVKKILHKQGVHAISVALAPPADITVLAAATFRGLPGNAEIDAQLKPDPKTAVRLDVKNARFGHFPPPVIRTAVQQILKRVLGGAHSPLPLRVTSVRVIGTDLVLQGVRKSILPAKSPAK
jgi:hypothetical protein